MPTILCQTCNEPIEYTEKQAGKSLPCPACGAIQALPGPDGKIPPAAAGAAMPDRAAARGLPAANGPEQPVMVVHPAMFGSKPFSFLVLWLAVIGGAAGGVFFALIAAPISLPFAAVCGGVALLCMTTLLFWRLSRRSRRLEITTRRIVDRQGLVAREVNEILIKDIRDVRVVQGVTDRILGIGKLSISTAGQSDYEIEIGEIPRPNRVREVIDVYRGI